MPDIMSGEALSGAAMTLAAVGVIGLVKWLVTAKAKQLDGLPTLIQQIQMELVKIGARLDRAEADIANDKAGRRAFAAVEASITKISTDIGHLAADLQKLSDRHESGGRDIWTAIERLRQGRDAA